MGAGDGDGAVSKGEGWELRLGKWQDVMADVECDALICDPPYSPRVHEGQRTGTETAKATIKYGAISPEWCAEFAASWSKRTKFWAVVFSDHLGSRWWESAWEACGWYVFAPVAWVRTNATPRVSGDGPTSAIDYITVARPRRRLESMRTGSRPGFYNAIQSSSTVVVPGGKALDGMRAIIRDYTRPSDLVCDPCAGGGTTLLAAALEGRRAIGAEMMPEHYDIARRRLAHLPQGTDRQPSLFGDDR